MPSPRKFHKTTFTIEVLSEEPLSHPLALEDIAGMITDGDCVGGPLKYVESSLTPKECADALYAFGSEPDFFQLDDEGNEVES
jgi:hypothetical protein